MISFEQLSVCFCRMNELSRKQHEYMNHRHRQEISFHHTMKKKCL